MMKITPKSSPLFSFLFILLSVNICSISATHYIRENFHQCLTHYFTNNANSISNFIYTPNNSSYVSILQSSIQNLRFASTSTPRPDLIVTPINESQIQQVIYCAKNHGIEIRIRSGGHDFEGLSSVSNVPFIILDMSNLRRIDINVPHQTAWVQVGVTLGELYYRIAEKSRTLGFPGGFWPSVCVGGLISGGGYGDLKRKYGLAADNVIDARLIDVNGKILDRKSMGEDLFWAIRGGGGSSFGVILAWKLNLVKVPKMVTVFAITRSLEQNATELVHRWQYIAHELPKDLYIRVQVQRLLKGNITFGFQSLFLGNVDSLIPLMEKRFLELGLVKKDCKEMSWIESVVYFSGLQVGSPLEILLNRTAPAKRYFKSKSDYVNEPISLQGLKGIWKMFGKLNDPLRGNLIMSPYGGRMSEIGESAIPFPHRAGNLYSMYEQVLWPDENTTTFAEMGLNWIREFSNYLTPYVSKNPRESYVNYDDLDLGVNTENPREINTWGVRYFKNNFARLIQVKRIVDPCNFFKHEQSIPLSLN